MINLHLLKKIGYCFVDFEKIEKKQEIQLHLQQLHVKHTHTHASCEWEIILLN